MTPMALVGILKSAVAVVAVFVVSIVVHEFGHFLFAKRFRVAVPQFAVGFGPKLIRWVRNRTEYSIRLFPIGGFVQLAGEIPQDSLFRIGEKIAVELDHDGRIRKLGDPSDVPNGVVAKLVSLDLMNRLEMTLETAEGTVTYSVIPHAELMTSARSSMPLVEKHEQVLGKPLWQRAVIILAGPAMNFLLAGVLFSLFNLHTGVVVNTSTLGRVIPGSAAAAVGLHSGDRIASVNGTPVSTWNDLVQQIQGDTSRPPAPLRLQVVRNGEQLPITVRPRLTSDGHPQLGIIQPVTYNKVRAVGTGFAFVYYGTINTVQLYGQVIAHHQFNNLAGPVGIAGIISQQAQSGVWQVIMVTGLLSLNLGLFNLLPIPALDGGRFLFMLAELVRGRALDPRKEGLVHFVGFALLMLFAAVITYRDVLKLF